MGDTITIRKYVRGTFVETYEQTIHLPDGMSLEDLEGEVDFDDGEELVDWLEGQSLLGDWGNSISFDDNEGDVEYEVENASDDCSED